MNGAAGTGTWPPTPEPPRVPPEITPPWYPLPDEPRRSPGFPPIPVVYEDAPPAGDVVDRLLERRIVLVGGHLDLARATDAAARLMFLDGRGDDPLELVMSCPDGELMAAMSLADTVELVGVEVRARCTGSIGGPAILPFAVATHRSAPPHATFRCSEPDLEASGPAREIAGATARHTELIDTLHRRIAAATGRAVDDVAADFRAHRTVTAAEARDLGLVDELLTRD